MHRNQWSQYMIALPPFVIADQSNHFSKSFLMCARLMTCRNNRPLILFGPYFSSVKLLGCRCMPFIMNHVFIQCGKCFPLAMASHLFRQTVDDHSYSQDLTDCILASESNWVSASFFPWTKVYERIYMPWISGTQVSKVLSRVELPTESLDAIKRDTKQYTNISCSIV